VGIEVLVGEIDLPIVPLQPFYSTEQQLLRVRADTRELKECAWEELARGDRGWVQRQGQYPRTFSRIGVDLFTVYPLPLHGPVTMLVNQIPAALVFETDVLQVPEEALAPVLSLAEALINLRRRMFDLAQASLGNLSDDLRALGVEIATPPQELPNATV
jgi:hypothetical protein